MTQIRKVAVLGSGVMGKYIMKLILLCWIVLLSATHSAIAQDFLCNPSGNQNEINACSEKSLLNTKSEMNILFQKKMLSLNKHNQSRLNDAQKAWEEFKDQTCNYEVGEKNEGGSSWEFFMNNCLIKMTKERINHLKEYIGCTNAQKGCPV